MRGKNKCICAVLVGMVLMCLLSACTVNGNDTDMEFQNVNDSAENELGPEGLPSEIDGEWPQAAENTGGEQSDSPASKQDENVSSEMEEMEERYKAILLGDEDFVNIEHSDQCRAAN